MPPDSPGASPGPVLLATYGTLMTGQINPLTPAVRARMRSLGPCLMDGLLFEIRGRTFRYPALILHPDGEPPPGAAPVHGEAFEIGATEAAAAPVLAETDHYEDCRMDAPARSTYLRLRRPIRFPDRPGTAEAWVYVYNRSVARAVPIPDGRWRGPDGPQHVMLTPSAGAAEA
ncbi:MAG: gamma-glutamylcyclotransferase [Proteobacteria bacterium]|nr:gamma-glutamylcyclotransferase [Pseudomonadota bacterium]